MWETAQNSPSQQGGLGNGFVSPQPGFMNFSMMGGGFGTGGVPMQQQQTTLDFSKPPPPMTQMPPQQTPPPMTQMPPQQTPPPMTQMPPQQTPPPMTQMPPKQQQKEVPVDEVKRKMQAKCSFCYSNGGDAIFVVGSLSHEGYLPLLVNFVVPRTSRGMEAFFMFQKAFVQTKSIVTLKEETKQIVLVDKVRLYTTEQWHNNGHSINDKVAEDLINSM